MPEVRGDQKAHIIQMLFDERWDEPTRTLRDPIITLTHVQDAIRATKDGNWNRPPLSDLNPANFMKDFTRNTASANERWPSAVFERGYTAHQVTGENACFEFVRLPPGATTAFSDLIPRPSDTTNRHEIESVSMPLASRRLGRTDEPWLVQVVVRLRVIETHMSLFSPRKSRIKQIDHLQMSVKLQPSEIDALFLAIEEDAGGAISEAILCCEAKAFGQDVAENQIVRQVRAVFSEIGQDVVIPIAVKAIGRSEVHVIEFDAVSRDQLPSFGALALAAHAVYRLVPDVPGIGVRRPRGRAPQRRRRGTR